MTSLQILFAEGKTKPAIPEKLFHRYPAISSDLKIHSGYPHIKGTRILVLDIFRALMKGTSLNSISKEFKSMNITVKRESLEEAYRFTVDWLHYLNEKEISKA